MAAPWTQPAKKQHLARGIARYLVKNTLYLVLFGLALFLPAGDWGWPAAWAFLAVMAFTQALNVIVLLSSRPDLLAERSQMQAGTKRWDMVLAPLVAMVGPLLVCIAAGLDRRFQGTTETGTLIQLIGLLLCLVGGLVSVWAMAVNAFFAATVRIQADRGQKVVTSGPYRYVRHPGYAGGVLFHLSAPLALGALWAYIPAALTVGLLFLRTALEDRTLLEELPGYSDYAGKTRYRLLPGIW